MSADKPLQDIDVTDAKHLCEAYVARVPGREDYLRRWCNAVGVAAAEQQGGSCAEHRDACLARAPFDCHEDLFLSPAMQVECPAMTVGAFLDCLVGLSRRGNAGYPGVTCTTPPADVLRYERQIEELVSGPMPDECDEALSLCPDMPGTFAQR